MAERVDWDARRLVQALELREDPDAKGFRRDALESLTASLKESGHLDPREPLDEQAVLNQVLAAANDLVNSGVLSVAEVRQHCAQYWQMASRP